MKRFLVTLVALFVLWVPASAEAAIAFDTATHQKVTTQTNTISMTLGSGATILIAYALVFPGETIPSTPTWNGVSMTQFGTVVSGGAGFRLYGWYLTSPATGTHNLAATRNTNSGNGFYLMGMSYSGAKWGAVSNTFTGTWTTTSRTQTLTSTENNSWMTTYVLNDQGLLAASTNSTLRSSVIDGAVAGFDNNGPITPAGSYSMTQTGNTAGAYGAVSAIIAPITQSFRPWQLFEF